jgi:hypothetical protein
MLIDIRVMRIKTRRARGARVRNNMYRNVSIFILFRECGIRSSLNSIAMENTDEQKNID